jgi:hypothetical protein
VSKVPTGFVKQDSPDLDPNGNFDPADLERLDKLPCTLFTDRCGTNYFVLELDGETYYLPVGTD